jgi:hypothetical protein
MTIAMPQGRMIVGKPEILGRQRGHAAQRDQDRRLNSQKVTHEVLQ